MKQLSAMRFASINKSVFGLLLIVTSYSSALAQTDIHITGAKSGFPVGVPQLCNVSGGKKYAKQIPQLVAKNLKISGLFKVLEEGSYVETPGKCIAPEALVYSDWSVIGAEGLVRGDIQLKNNVITAKMYLYDILQKRIVVGKRYQAEPSDFAIIAHKFSNEIVGYFTGQKGIFGSKIAYVARVDRFKELFIMDIDGSNSKQLTRDKGLALSPSWSPGGNQLVYTSYRTRRPELYYLSPNGGLPRRITKRPGLELGAKFSPDGTRLLTSASQDGITKIALFDLRGRMIRRLTRSGAIDVSPSWSPDGKRIAFCSNRAGGPQIYVMNSDGSKIRRISFVNSGYCTSPSWSPKGDKIAFVCRKKGNQIFMATPQGTEPTQLTFAGINEDPNWSPDGRFIVFSSNFAKQRRKNIAILSLLGGVPTQISFSKRDESQPTWGPVLN